MDCDGASHVARVARTRNATTRVSPGHDTAPVLYAPVHGSKTPVPGGFASVGCEYLVMLACGWTNELAKMVLPIPEVTAANLEDLRAVFRKVCFVYEKEKKRKACCLISDAAMQNYDAGYSGNACECTSPSSCHGSSRRGIKCAPPCRRRTLHCTLPAALSTDVTASVRVPSAIRILWPG